MEKKEERNGCFKDVMAKMCIQIFPKRKNKQTNKTKQKQKKVNKGGTKEVERKKGRNRFFQTFNA